MYNCPLRPFSCCSGKLFGGCQNSPVGKIKEQSYLTALLLTTSRGVLVKINLKWEDTNIALRDKEN